MIDRWNYNKSLIGVEETIFDLSSLRFSNPMIIDLVGKSSESMTLCHLVLVFPFLVSNLVPPNPPLFEVKTFAEALVEILVSSATLARLGSLVREIEFSSFLV